MLIASLPCTLKARDTLPLTCEVNRFSHSKLYYFYVNIYFEECLSIVNPEKQGVMGELFGWVKNPSTFQFDLLLLLFVYTWFPQSTTNIYPERDLYFSSFLTMKVQIIYCELFYFVIFWMLFIFFWPNKLVN